ncbi:hypothetical protein QYM36_019694 [Artemia franciscana]|uniref:Uncharacterized protein n=1 Tax=Artemia franciscana TaxID=6661 RepID=A0AA88H6W3_ARTSF|nr:hypothetical protein QYM36_019694 [Artemia franciscana]
MATWSPGRSYVTSYFKFHIQENAIGYSYEQIFSPHLGRNVNDAKVEDPYIRQPNRVGCKNTANITSDELNHTSSADSIKFWSLAMLSVFLGCVFSTIEVLNDHWAFKTLTEERQRDSETQFWKQFGYIKGMGAIDTFVDLILTKVIISQYSILIFVKLLPLLMFSIFILSDLIFLICFFEEARALADGNDPDEIRTSENPDQAHPIVGVANQVQRIQSGSDQDENSCKDGIFKNIKNNSVWLQIFCLFLLPIIFAALSRGSVSYQFSGLLEDILSIQGCHFIGSFRARHYFRLKVLYILGEGVSFALSGLTIQHLKHSGCVAFAILFQGLCLVLHIITNYWELQFLDFLLGLSFWLLYSVFAVNAFIAAGSYPKRTSFIKGEEFLNRYLVKEENMYLILVEKRKTASLKSVSVSISLREENIFKEYLSFVQPALLKPGALVLSNFPLSTTGTNLENMSVIQRFLKKVFPNGLRPVVSVPAQTIVRHLITTINRKATNKTETEQDMMHEYLCHSGKFHSV